MKLKCVSNTHPWSVMFTEGKEYEVAYSTKRTVHVLDDIHCERCLVVEDGKASFSLGTENESPFSKCFTAKFEVV